MMPMLKFLVDKSSMAVLPREALAGCFIMAAKNLYLSYPIK